MLSNIKTILTIAAVLIVVLVGWTVYSRITGLQEDNTRLRENAVALEAALTEQRRATDTALEALDEWEAALAAYQETLEDYRREQINASAEIRRLNELFSEHDLGALALERPGLIERRVNAGSDNIGWLLECATGGGTDCPDRGAEAP